MMGARNKVRHRVGGIEARACWVAGTVGYVMANVR